MTRTAKRRDTLPEALPWRGLSREEAAAYIGIAPSFFDEMVADGRMPGPKRIKGDPESNSKGRTIWDIRKLDIAFEALPENDGGTGSIKFSV